MKVLKWGLTVEIILNSFSLYGLEFKEFIYKTLSLSSNYKASIFLPQGIFASTFAYSAILSGIIQTECQYNYLMDIGTKSGNKQFIIFAKVLRYFGHTINLQGLASAIICETTAFTGIGLFGLAAFSFLRGMTSLIFGYILFNHIMSFSKLYKKSGNTRKAYEVKIKAFKQLLVSVGESIAWFSLSATFSMSACIVLGLGLSLNPITAGVMIGIGLLSAILSIGFNHFPRVSNNKNTFFCCCRNDAYSSTTEIDFSSTKTKYTNTVNSNDSAMSTQLVNPTP